GSKSPSAKNSAYASPSAAHACSTCIVTVRRVTRSRFPQPAPSEAAAPRTSAHLLRWEAGLEPTRRMYPQVFGKYVLERELARGGMARVVLATLRGAGGFEKKLVVKQVRDELASDDEFVRRFVEEAKTTVALAHPNIVPVYELGVELGTYFLAMEYVEGASLAELLRASAQDGRALSPEEGANVGVGACPALASAPRALTSV